MAEFPYVVEGACSYWVRHGLNAPADRDDAAAVTMCINPGMLGYDKRLANTVKAKALLGEPFSPAPTAGELDHGLRALDALNGFRQ